jgi:hypothetical protein
MIPDTVDNMVAAILIGLGVCGLIVCVVMLVRERRKDRQWRQQWEAQRRHLAELRARAEAELAAEGHEQKGRCGG